MPNLRAHLLGLLLAGGLALAGQPAGAATYFISGTFDGGGLMTGSFDFDAGTLSNVDVTTSGAIEGHYTDGSYFASSDPDDAYQQFYFSNGSYRMGLTRYSLSPDFRSPDWDSFEFIDQVTSTRDGQATLTVTPIPAALPLAASALAGLGGLGWVSRRRRDGDALAAA